jgi:hypothetical protein
MSEVKYSYCDFCSAKEMDILTYDVWAIANGKRYCYNCQKEHKVGWFEEK